MIRKTSTRSRCVWVRLRDDALIWQADSVGLEMVRVRVRVRVLVLVLVLKMGTNP